MAQWGLEVQGACVWTSRGGQGCSTRVCVSAAHGGEDDGAEEEDRPGTLGARGLLPACPLR